METVGRMVGGVVHDFANLLTLISGYSEILLSHIGETDPLRPELEEIRKAATRGAGLTQQLLGFTRGQTVEPKPLDLNVLIGEIERMLRPMIGEYIDLKIVLAPNLGKVMADHGQMEQVLMNLILNARDAMPGGGWIAIETSVCELDEAAARAHGVNPGQHVMLSITDTGHGMDGDTVARVFQPFFTTKEKGKGTGIGLSNVRDIVRQSGGDVWVRSAPGEGASFTLCLPRIQQGAESAAPKPCPEIHPAGSEIILLVEDEDDVRRLLSHILRSRGYCVLEASDPEEALRIFDDRAAEIDLVLTDMVMPKMSGRELGDRLRQKRPAIRLMYMSGYTDDVLVRTGALGPGMAFLQKPLRPGLLATKIREALDSPVRPLNPR
jgi:CheY-like chemotaxis protein